MWKRAIAVPIRKIRDKGGSQTVWLGRESASHFEQCLTTLKPTGKESTVERLVYYWDRWRDTARNEDDIEQLRNIESRDWNIWSDWYIDQRCLPCRNGGCRSGCSPGKYAVRWSDNSVGSGSVSAQQLPIGSRDGHLPAAAKEGDVSLLLQESSRTGQQSASTLLPHEQPHESYPRRRGPISSQQPSHVLERHSRQTGGLHVYCELETGSGIHTAKSPHLCLL